MEVYLNVSAGSGPRECEWVVVNLAKQFVREATAEGLTAELMWKGEPAPHSPSLLLKVQGKGVDTFVQDRTGSIKWMGESPYRPNHKRKNWFVSVKRAPSVADVPTLNTQDVDYQTMKASGPGGQHVNTTDSAVRATHRPSGVTVVAKEERSQHANKKLALMKLAMILEDQRAGEAASAKEAAWRQNQLLERGNEVRSYTGPKFKRR